MFSKLFTNKSCLITVYLIVESMNFISINTLFTPISFGVIFMTKSFMFTLTRVLLISADDDIDIEGLLPEKDTTASGAEGDLTGSEDTDEFWKPFIASSVEKSIKANNGYVSRKEHKSNLKKDDSEDIEEAKSEEMSNAEPESPKTVRKNKWKAEEVKKLIGLRSDLRDRFKVVKGRMILWEEISQSLLADGIRRSPAQCKSLWRSLVLTYEVCFL